MARPINSEDSYLALDVGEKRVGLAIASEAARLPRTLGTIENSPQTIWHELKELIAQNQVSMVVVGLPRSLDGQETHQTFYVHRFAHELRKNLKVKIVFQDEALTTVQAESELKAKGVQYNKADVDALSAVYILSDFLKEV